MTNARSLRLFSLLGLGANLAALMLTASLAGCASGGAPVASKPDEYTASDEPEARKRASTRLQLALLYYKSGKYNIALDEVKQTIAIDPNWYEPYGMRSLVYLQLGDYAQAEASLKKALSINPAASDLKHNYGYLLCRMKRPNEAMQQFAAALADPNYGARAMTWAQQGMCQLENGQKVQAEESFRRSYELDAGNPDTGYQLSSLLYGRGEYVRAQFYVRRINNSERASAQSLWLGIKVERSLGFKDAQAQLETQLRKRFAESAEAAALERGAYDE